MVVLVGWVRWSASILRLEQDAASHCSLWSKESGETRTDPDVTNLAEWIRLKEDGMSKKYSQELTSPKCRANWVSSSHLL